MITHAPMVVFYFNATVFFILYLELIFIKMMYERINADLSTKFVEKVF